MGESVFPNSIAEVTGDDILDHSHATGSRLRDVFLLVCVSIGVFVFAHYDGLASRFVINDDVRQQIYWMQSWCESGLYQSDLQTDYARLYVPWGVRGVYRAAAFLIDPLRFSNILAGALFVSMAACIFMLGNALSGIRVAWSSVCVYWLMPIFIHNMAGGIARSFAAPLLALFWLSWLRRSAIGMALTLLLQALFIPYIFLLCAVAALISWILSLGRSARLHVFPITILHFVALAGCASLVMLWQAEMYGAGYGPLVWASEMVGRPEFTKAGRYGILPIPSVFMELVVNPWEWIAPFREGGPRFGIPGCVLIAVIVVLGATRVAWREQRKIIRPVLCVWAASLVLYVVARIFMLRLFIPSRYLSYTVNITYCLLLGLCFAAIAPALPRSRVGLLSCLLSIACLAGVRLRNVGLYDYSDGRELYAAIRETPKDSLIAGHPRLMDNVLCFGRRKVLTSFELAHPWSKGYWQKIKPRLDDTVAAYYSSDQAELAAFCSKYGVDFLVVDSRHFERDFIAGAPLFEPYDAAIRNKAAGVTGFAVLSYDPTRVRTVDENTTILDMRQRTQRYTID